jgi:hypothetical protein
MGVEIHHIDGHPENNEEDNLIPLCGYCAKLAHVKFPAETRIHGLSVSQLKLYKKTWIEKCSSKTPFSGPEWAILNETLLKIDGKIDKLAERKM